MEEIRRGSIVISKDDDATRLGDTVDFLRFKKEVLDRLDKLEKDLEKIKAVKKIEHTK